MKTASKFVALLALVAFGIGWSGDAVARAEPAYAKWGRVAMQETAKRYRADIVDYKHLGRKTEGAGVASESFKLILNNGARRFGVTVTISFEERTDRVVRIQFTEDGRSVGRTEPRYRII